MLESDDKADLQLNIYGKPLKICSKEPLTGFFRDGCCNTAETDFGSHTVCVEVTEDFLMFSKAKGNDLVSPRPEFGFDGLRSGDRWCICASRWLEAQKEGKAPPVIGDCTNLIASEIIPKNILFKHLVKVN